ncbi:MAG: hypothetical protein L0228_08590 [Planctomycetes bacterium]|nr:hypothetical protein [Planctomycetota bacterium]
MRHAFHVQLRCPFVCMLVVGVSWGFWTTATWSITTGHVDNFNDGTLQDWRVGSLGDFPAIQTDFGPSGSGDHSLWMATSGAGGSVARLIVLNDSTNWTGNWTAAGVARVELDVLGPSSNSFPLMMRLGIAGGPSGPGPGGSGDTYVTSAIQVSSDNQWHRITFDVLSSDFIPIGGQDIDDALSQVIHFRILHNPEDSFNGADTSFGGGEFYLDNIRALAAPTIPDPTGDYNQDGVVDAADYVLWRKTFGQSADPPGSGADGDESGTIDNGDYTFWRMRFGEMPTGSGGSVPEPGPFLPLLTGVVGLRFFAVPRRRVHTN